MNKNKKNVILITIDSLRADHLSCYGYERGTSPNIDRLAEQGIIFKQAISNGGHTRIAFPSLFTSTYFFSGKFLEKTREGFIIRLFDDRPYLPEILKMNGYKTAGFHSNPFLTERFGYAKGFDILYDPLQRRKIIIESRIKSFARKYLQSNSLLYRLFGLLYNRFFFRNVKAFARG